MSIAKVALCILGLGLYASNPWRDVWFYETIAANEGFRTTTDAYIIGFAFQLLATVIFFPIALLLILYGIGKAQRIAVLPKLDRFTWVWGCFSSLLFLAMLLVEGERLAYCLRHIHHWKTSAITACYIGFIYVWWSCSIAHGERKNERKKKESKRGRSYEPMNNPGYGK